MEGGGVGDVAGCVVGFGKGGEMDVLVRRSGVHQALGLRGLLCGVFEVDWSGLAEISKASCIQRIGRILKDDGLELQSGLGKDGLTLRRRGVEMCFLLLFFERQCSFFGVITHDMGQGDVADFFVGCKAFDDFHRWEGVSSLLLACREARFPL